LFIDFVLMTWDLRRRLDARRVPRAPSPQSRITARFVRERSRVFGATTLAVFEPPGSRPSRAPFSSALLERPSRAPVSEAACARPRIRYIGCMAPLHLSAVALALGGGALIGLAAGLAYLVLGRVCGISGILGGIIPGDADWRLAFLAGLLTVGAVAAWAFPERVAFGVERSTTLLAISGLLVGFGTRLGSGCTSGHGVCGISRFSPRSIVATAVFMAAGMVVASSLSSRVSP
jgi:hypothetical protein